MRKCLFGAVVLLFLAACGSENTPKTPTTLSTVPDSVAIAQTIHGFYKWYNSQLPALDTAAAYQFADASGSYWRLDEKKLDTFLAAFAATGFVAAEFIDNERFFYKKSAQDWPTTPVDNIPTGRDADKYLCAQDGAFEEFETARVVVTPNALNPTRAMAELLFAPNSPNGKKRRFELVKTDGKWLLTGIECDMGVNEARPAH